MVVDRTARLLSCKRVVDLFCILLSSPVTGAAGLVTAGLVRSRLGSPVLYRQQRIGLANEPFDVLKFRTMTDEAGEDGQPLPDRDRLTPFGRLLRKTSLDELPQLVSVLRGDMSLVGPRPLLPGYLSWYSQREGLRHNVRPGLTGLAQVSGRNSLTWDDRLELDVQYVENLSLRLDAIIVLKTVKKLFKASGVSVIAGETGAPLNVERAFPRSERVRLRRLARGDLATRAKWMAHPATMKYTRIPSGITLLSTEEWFQTAIHSRDRLDFVAVDLAGQRIAMAGVKRLPNTETGEFYIFVDPDRAGEGVGGEVTRLVMDWATRTGEYRDLLLEVHAHNAAARKIYERLGWTITEEKSDRVSMAFRLGQ